LHRDLNVEIMLLGQEPNSVLEEIDINGVIQIHQHLHDVSQPNDGLPR
jgi:hypothetical protein